MRRALVRSCVVRLTCLVAFDVSDDVLSLPSRGCIVLSDGLCVFLFASGRVTSRCGARALWLRRCVFFFVRYRHITLHFSVATDVYSAFCRHRCDVIRCPARQLPCVLFSCRLTSRHRPT